MGTENEGQKRENFNEGGEEEKWLKYYSSKHNILLVGEGDFSFSLSLALAFGSASNIVASSLDTYDVLIKKYKRVKSNLVHLERLGASLLYGVDATKMKSNPDLQMWKFDRIIFNFPHAGFYGREDNPDLINMHRELVDDFLRNAASMLRVWGQIHVNHRTTGPYSKWNLKELAQKNSLEVIECVAFKKEDYPGYNNKRGHRERSDEPFRLGVCSTYKFRVCPKAKKRSQKEISVQMQQQPTSFDQGRLPSITSDVPGYVGLPFAGTMKNDLTIIASRYINHVEERFAGTGYDMGYKVNEPLRLDLEGPRHFRRDIGAVPSAFEGHANAMSRPSEAHWRRPRPYTGHPLEDPRGFGSPGTGQVLHLQDVMEEPGHLGRHLMEALRAVGSDMLRAPGRTINGDMYVLNQLERQLAIKSMRLDSSSRWSHQL